VAVVCLDLMALLVLKGKLVIEEKLALWVPKERLEMWEGQDLLVFRASGDLQEEQDQEVLADLQAKLVNQDKMVKMENLDLKGFRAFLVLWELLVTKVQWESRVGKEIQVYLDSKGLEEIQEKMVHLEALVLQAL
jgi:hypothetical protein